MSPCLSIIVPGLVAAPLPLEHEAAGMPWGPGQESGAEGKRLVSQTLSPAALDFYLSKSENVARLYF